MPTLDLPGGATLWYKKTGKGKPLLQIHGSAFGHRNFEKVTPVAACHYEVIDFDLPGYGESRAPKPPANLGEIADLVHGLIVGLGYPKVHVHGTSFGAMIAVNLAARHPEVIDRLVLSCFLARYDRAARMMRATWKRAARESGMAAVADLTSVAGFARGFYDRPEAEAQLASMREAFSKTAPNAFVAGTEAIEKSDLSPLIPGIRLPVLLIGGREDNMTPFQPSQSGVGFSTVSKMLPDCRMEILDDCGHYLVIEQPEKTVDLIKAFISPS